MAEILAADVLCSRCDTAWEVHYSYDAAEPSSQNLLGCPECQSVADVPALIRDLEAEAGLRFLNITALVKKTEIGVGAARTPGINPMHESAIHS